MKKIVLVLSILPCFLLVACEPNPDLNKNVSIKLVTNGIREWGFDWNSSKCPIDPDALCLRSAITHCVDMARASFAILSPEQRRQLPTLLKFTPCSYGVYLDVDYIVRTLPPIIYLVRTETFYERINRLTFTANFIAHANDGNIEQARAMAELLEDEIKGPFMDQVCSMIKPCYFGKITNKHSWYSFTGIMAFLKHFLEGWEKWKKIYLSSYPFK
jgi:hypothetical protein